MALPINIEDLLHKNKVESNRIEFKEGWNPDDIFRTICAFATDFEDTGGGYIIIGVQQDSNGVAIRPVKGLPIETIDSINKKIVNYENKISPRYICKTSVEEIDGKYIFVIWAPAGINRPYCVSENVTVKKSPQFFYVRSKASTIEAKGEILDQVRELASRVPFDERGNDSISIDDISPLLVYNHLVKVGSKLKDSFHDLPILEILDKMDLLTGPIERRAIKNVAAMMFCEHPEKFFPVTQVDIVWFPEGSIENPDYIIEVPKIVGPVPKMIEDALSYIRTNVIKQRILKPVDSEKSVKVFNYPYQAFEESISNCLYHRDYQEREPVEITIEPTHIDILSFAGPDRSISSEAIKEAKKLKARRYRNRRLGDFLKELDLTEGRSTGIPTIQKHLAANGNSPATIETDIDRTYFLITIPCREDMIGQLFNNSISNLSSHDNISPLAVQVYNAISNESKDALMLMTTGLKQEPVSFIRDIIQILDSINQQYNTRILTRLVQLNIELYKSSWCNFRFKDKIHNLIMSSIQTVSILYKEGNLTAKNLTDISEIEKIYEFKRKVLEPLVLTGFVKMSNPDKPTSSKQEYLLTEKGRKLFV